MSSVYDPWLRRWALTPDGDPIFSNWSQLLPVRRGNERLMLKAAMAEQEIAGSVFLQGLDGEGAARVLEREHDAVLLERLDGPTALAELAKQQGDRAALAVLCGVAQRIHSLRSRPLFEGLIPVEQWFSALTSAASERGSLDAQAAATFDALLRTAGPRVVLHGDIHHANVMQRATGEWAAIDPKGLVGEATLDFAMMIMVDVHAEGGIGDAQGAIRRAPFVADMAGLDTDRLLAWTFCQFALYAIWARGHPIEAVWRPLAEGLLPFAMR